MFQPKQISTMAMFIAFNVAIGGFVHIIKLPIYLDAIGTIVAAVMLGLVPAIVVGVFSFVLAAALISPVYIWFSGTQAVIAIVVYLAARHLMIFRSAWRVVPSGILLGVITGIASAPIIVYLFGGVAGSGRDLITAGLISTGDQIYKAVLLSGAASEPVDKLLQMLIAFAVLRGLPKRALTPFANPVLERNNLL